MINLDWEAYFEKFKEVHGADPIVYRGRLLFPDGWTYSKSDKAGPEWPPPIGEELLILKRAYWTERLRVVTEERDILFSLIQQVRNLQSTKSAPLQHRIEGEIDSKGFSTTEVLDVNLDGMESGRLQWLNDDVEQCEEKLRELQ